MEMTTYTTILHYKGYAIIVENWIYRLATNPYRRFLSMNDMKSEIDKIEIQLSNQKSTDE